MQSLSKIERGVNYPTFDTLEKIIDVLGVTPNELLSGEWKYIDHTEPYIMDVIKREQDFNVSLDYLSENEFFNDERECRFYMEYKLIQYIHNYITNEVTAVSYTHLDVYKRQGENNFRFRRIDKKDYSN